MTAYQYIEKKHYRYCDPMGYLHTEPFIIYMMVDPSDNQFRYIGQTTNGIKRICNHFTPSILKIKGYKNSWIKSVQAKGLKPIVLITHKADSQIELNAKEKELVETFNKCVHLTNIAEGGNSKGRLNPRIKIPANMSWSQLPNYSARLEATLKHTKMRCLHDQHGKFYRSISDAARMIGSSGSNIRKQLTGKAHHVKGYIFTDAIVKGDTAQAQAYIDGCLAVKAKYPK